jgi:hypothetical protein
VGERRELVALALAVTDSRGGHRIRGRRGELRK